MSSDIFAHRKGNLAGRPLAEKMRPRVLDEFVGQEHIVGPGKLLSRAIEQDKLPSLILWGPPGCGKTTLARLVAKASGASLVSMSAVLSGVKDLRAAVAEAEQRRNMSGRKTILFVDEIHRFNKTQQDALLPHVEAGTVVFMGATTENPSFEVVSALLSRCKVLKLEPLSEEHIEVLLQRAIDDDKRGLGKQNLKVEKDILRLIAQQSGGDARRALNTIEVAANIARPGEQGAIIDAECVREALQRKMLSYDKGGEEHYNVVSAFIKSLRGSDPDGAVYWMVRMLEAGEDPLFILRRMVIFASEDVGNADPGALKVAVSATEAFRFVGLPEGVLPMTQAALYLATAPKSNSVLTTYAAARKDVMEKGALPVPMHLRNAPTKLMKSMGYSKGYRYPHNFDGNYVPQQYLPDELAGARYFRPTNSGYEEEIALRLARWHTDSMRKDQGRKAARIRQVPAEQAGTSGKEDEGSGPCKESETDETHDGREDNR